jgi:hypothetical protein
MFLVPCNRIIVHDGFMHLKFLTNIASMCACSQNYCARLSHAFELSREYCKNLHLERLQVSVLHVCKDCNSFHAQEIFRAPLCTRAKLHIQTEVLGNHKVYISH